MPSPPRYDRITRTSDAEGLFKGLRPGFTSSALIKEVLGEWRACRGAFTLSRSMFGTARPSGSPVPFFTPPTAPKEGYLHCSLRPVSGRPRGVNDDRRSDSESGDAHYLSNESRCVGVSPGAASLHSWWVTSTLKTLESRFCGSSSGLDILTDGMGLKWKPVYTLQACRTPLSLLPKT